MARKKGSQNFVKIQRVRIRNKDNERVFNYQQWREEQERYDETGIADPDILGDETVEPTVMLEIEHTKERVQYLIKKAQQILTERQYQVFQLVAIDAVSFRKAAAVLSKRLNKSISWQSIQQTWETAREKLSKLNV